MDEFNIVLLAQACSKNSSVILRPAEAPTRFNVDADFAATSTAHLQPE
jgi:hypothetical protein